MSFYRDGGDYTNRKNEDDDRKLFVGGLSWETSKDDLKQYFEQFGEVTYCALKTDPNTGKSRGFGFVTFADESSVIKVVQQREHELGGRNIDPKRAKSRSTPDWGPVKKIFVGGLDPNTTEEVIRDYFGKFGTIVEFSHPYDKKKQQKKGFCFITFDKPDVAHNIVGNQMSSRHSLGSYDVDVKKAVEQQPGPGGYQQEGWGQQGWGSYNQQGGWGGGARGGGQPGRRGDSYDQGRGWGGDVGGYYGNYGGGNYGSGSYGQQGGYDNYSSGGGGQQNYYNQQGYHGYNNGYD